MEEAAASGAEALLANARHITDTHIENSVMSTLSDIGGVRSGVGGGAGGDEGTGDNEGAEDEGGFIVSHSTVVAGQDAGKIEEAAIIGAIEEATTAKDERCLDTVQISRDDQPLSEFSENDRLLSGAFWWLFMLQAPWLPKGSLDVALSRHLLLQYDCKIAHEIDFLMLLNSQRLRHEAARAFKCRMDLTPQAWRRFRKHREDPEWPQLLQKAKKNPAGPEAKKVRARAFGFLHIAGKTIKGTAAERAACKGELYALARRFGVASVFWTIAFDDVHDPRVLRLSFQSLDNASFPAVAHDFSRQLYNDEVTLRKFINLGVDGAGNVEKYDLPIDEAFVQEVAALNPVATSLVYDHLLRIVLEILLGTGEQSASSRTVPIHERVLGIFGKLLASYVVTEVTGRKAKHAHGLSFGGVMPAMLANLAHIAELLSSNGLLRQAMESQSSTGLPFAVHVADGLRLGLRGDHSTHLRLPYSPCARTGQQLSRQAFASAAEKNSHTWHHKTCRKRPHGEHACRMGCKFQHPTVHPMLECVECVEANDGDGGGNG